MKFEAKKNIEKGIGEWLVTVEGDEWKQTVAKARNSAKNNIQIPGFRKGKVPADMVKNYLTDAKVLQEAHRLMVRKAYDFALSQKSEVQPFNQPSIGVKRLSNELYVLAIEFDLRPEANIKKYVGFNDIAKHEIKATKEQIDRAIDQYREKFAVYQPKETAIAKGDTVVFDFEGFMDGKPFSGGKADNFTLVIGSNQFIPGFEDKMIGMMPNSESSIEVNFPEDYHVANLKGKPAVFKLQIHDVKSKTLPAVNDELVKDLNLKTIKNIADFKAHVKNNIETQLRKQENDRFVGELLRAIASDSKITIPESIINKEVKKLKGEFEQKVNSQNMDMKTYKRKTGMNDKAIEEALFDDAKSRIENGIIIDYVMNKEKMEVSDAEVEAEYEKLAQQFSVDAETLKNGLISKEKIVDEIKNDKLFNFLYENNGTKVIEAKVDEVSVKPAKSTAAKSTTSKTKSSSKAEPSKPKTSTATKSTVKK